MADRRPALWTSDIGIDEWAHAMAPRAKTYVVEATSSGFADLLRAVSVANSDVSMTWGGSEFT